MASRMKSGLVLTILKLLVFLTHFVAHTQIKKTHIAGGHTGQTLEHATSGGGLTIGSRAKHSNRESKTLRSTPMSWAQTTVR